MKRADYNRLKAIEYAKKWAYGRNPRYYNFDSIGGDCTSFISQCIYAGSGIMNYTKETGWYYNSVNDRSPAWSSVEYLHRFLINNKNVGPRGQQVEIDKLEKGDLIQLSFDGIKFSHTLIIVDIDMPKTLDNIYIASHTYDSFNRRVSSYNFQDIRYIHINGVWKW